MVGTAMKVSCANSMTMCVVAGLAAALAIAQPASAMDGQQQKTDFGAMEGAVFFVQMAQQIEDLNIRVRTLELDLAETRLRLGEVETPYFPVTGGNRQPSAGAANPSLAAPADPLNVEEPPFVLMSVRRVQGQPQAEVKFPGQDETVIATDRASLDGWTLSGVDVHRHTAIFNKASQLVELGARE